MMTLQQTITKKRRLTVLSRRLNRLRLRYFDHVDAGKEAKHVKLVKFILKAIRKLR